MSSQELFNDLLALRISLQEDHSDETFIIRELKMFLISRNIPPNNINQVVKEFYQSFDINFENGFIESIPISAPFHPMFMNNLSNLINSVSSNLDDQIMEEMDSDSDESNEELLDSSENNIEENQSGNTLEQTLDISENQFEQNYDQSNNLPLFPQTPQFNHNNQLNYMGSNIFNNPYGQFFSALNGMIGSIPINAGNNMEDVKVTLEENEIENFKEYVLEEDQETKCSICMMQFKKGDTLLELKCEHSFHKDCISHYLKEYSYKCPICRKECGKAKFHV